MRVQHVVQVEQTLYSQPLQPQVAVVVEHRAQDTQTQMVFQAVQAAAELTKLAAELLVQEQRIKVEMVAQVVTTQEQMAQAVAELMLLPQVLALALRQQQVAQE